MRIGRITRGTYVVISLTITIINFLFYTFYEVDSMMEINTISLYLFLFLIFITILNIGRLKDLNLSGWYAILFFIPVINLSVIALYFIDGTRGVNKYGKDPKGRINEKEYLAKKNNYKNDLKNSIAEIDSKIQLLENSYNDQILNKNEFELKKQSLLNQKKKLTVQIEKRISYKEKLGKLKSLLESEIISEKEYNSKLLNLTEEFAQYFGHDQLIDLQTKIYYLSKGKEYGPIEARKVASLVNTKQISPNCFVRIENERGYNRRAHEIAKIFSSD